MIYNTQIKLPKDGEEVWWWNKEENAWFFGFHMFLNKEIYTHWATKDHISFPPKINIEAYSSYGDLLCQELTEAIKYGGEYTYYDKGANEVMDLYPHMEHFKTLTPNEIAEILTYVTENHENPNELVNTILWEYDIQDLWEDLFQVNPKLEEYL